MQVDNLRVRTGVNNAGHPVVADGERQSLIVDSLPIVFYTAAPKGHFSGPRFLSESIAGAIGFTADAFVEDPDLWAARIHPDDLGRLQAHLRRMYDTGSLSIEYRWRCADGSERVFLDQGVLERDTSGAPREVLGTCLDITGRRGLEKKMALSEMTATADSLQNGLIHDFNNILSAIIWNLDLLGRSPEGDVNGSELIQSAMGSALNGIELLRQISVDAPPRLGMPLATEKPPADAGYAPSAQSNDPVILVVEDDTVFRRIAVTQTRKLGYRVLEADNAAAALDILRTDQPIDLLFTDVVMIGGMDGFALARRAADLRPALKVLITSGYLPAEHRILSLSERFLSKPYSSDELRRALALALHKDPS